MKKIIKKAILERIGLINDYLEDLTFDEFKEDKKTIDAIKSNIIDIAQGLKDLEKKAEYELDFEDKQLIKLRNQLTHIYWKDKVEEIWHVSKKFLPNLTSKFKKSL